MEEEYNRLRVKIRNAHDSCSLISVNAFNPYQFEKMLHEIFEDFSKKGIKEDMFEIILKITLNEMGASYQYDSFKFKAV